MSQYGQANKCNASWGCSKIMLPLHTARTENPVTPQTHLIPWIPLRHPKTPPKHPPDISREVKMSTDNNMPQETPPDILKQHLTVSKGVWGCLFISVFVCWLLEFLKMSGGEWGMSGRWGRGVSMGIWAVFMEIYGDGMYLGGIWVLRPFSMEL